MRQLITRVDDELHAKLKARADAEGRSVNSLVVDALAAAVEQAGSVSLVRLRAGARVFQPPRPARVPSREEAERAGAGAGTAVSEALTADRSAR